MKSSNQTYITNGSAASSDNSAAESGAAYVLKRVGTVWVQEAYLKAPNAEASDRFGASVAISGDTIVVGAYNEDSSQTTITNGPTASSDNSATDSGAAYVFKRVGTDWSQEAYLKPSNAQASGVFGNAVAISGDTIVVGAYNSSAQAGAAYVFKRTGATWVQEAYLTASNGETYDKYGYSVAISGNTIVVGAYWEDSNQTTITNGTTSSTNNLAVNSGAVYVYKRTGSTWAQEAYLKASNVEASDEFGRSVAISGDTIAVGAINEDSNQTSITNGTTSSVNNSATNSGAVYVYKRNVATWIQEAYIKAPNADTYDEFGGHISIENDIMVVGATSEDSSQTTISNSSMASSDNSTIQSGAAYVYRRAGSTWSQEAYLKAANAESQDGYGYRVATSGDTIVVSTYSEDSNQTTITNGTTASSDNSAASAGAAYVYIMNRP